MKSSSCVRFGMSMVMAILVMAFTSAGYAADKVSLRLASEYPDKHPTVKNAIMPWIKEVSEKTDGKLKIQFFNPNTLCATRDANAALMSGAADMVLTPTQISARGKFPVSVVAAMPFLVTDAEIGSKAVWEIYHKYPEFEKEYAEMKVLWQWVSAPFEIHTSKKTIKTLEDLQGMKLLAWSGDLAEIAKLLGANPIESTASETYLALQRGMADGVICPIAPMRANKISDVVKYHTIVGLMTTHFYAGVNLKKWDSLSPEMQKVLVETGEKMVLASGKTLDEGVVNDTAWMKENGHEFFVLSKEERARWQEKVEPLVEEWIAKMEDNGLTSARQMVDDIFALNAK